MCVLGGRMSGVSIIGSGQVGSTCANLLVQKNLADVILVDVVEGLPQGKALDIMQSAPILNFSSKIIGTNDFSEIVNSDIIVITAGSARKPGMTRSDLLKTNAQVVKSVVQQVVKYAPSSIILVVTNPVDVMAYFAYKISGFDSRKVIGVSGVLDSARFNYFIAQELNVSIADVEGMVIGAHDDTMLPLVNYSKAHGESISKLLPSNVLNRLVERTKKGGAEIVSYLKTGSAFYAPGASVAYVVEIILKDKQEALPVSAYLTGQYGLNDLYIGVLCKLGSKGIIEILEIDLTLKEAEDLKESAQSVKEGMKVLGGSY
jgi:malate dehydrogenase